MDNDIGILRVIRKRSGRITEKQRTVIINFMGLHPEFAVSKVVGSRSSAGNSQKWLSLKAMLDNLGPVKSVAQWKTAWKELKLKARKKYALRRSFEPGSKEAIDNELTNEELKILATIKEGHAQKKERPSVPKKEYTDVYEPKPNIAKLEFDMDNDHMDTAEIPSSSKAMRRSLRSMKKSTPPVSYKEDGDSMASSDSSLPLASRSRQVVLSIEYLDELMARDKQKNASLKLGKLFSQDETAEKGRDPLVDPDSIFLSCLQKTNKILKGYCDAQERIAKAKEKKIIVMEETNTILADLLHKINYLTAARQALEHQ